ncbi:MAG: glycosyltransferase [Acidimicrobiales bacterium]
MIVPVYNRRRLLRQLLDALAAQTLGDHEVVVVDDGSDDGSGEEAEVDASAGRPVRLVRTLRSGAVAARRAGVVTARAELLAFIDSDCVPVQGWLAAGVEALERGADLANGVTRPAGPVGFLDHSVASGEEGLYPTCNVFYRRSAYAGAGGFDPAAADRLGFRLGRRARRLGIGEDPLLAWRVRRRGRAASCPRRWWSTRSWPAGWWSTSAVRGWRGPSRRWSGRCPSSGRRSCSATACGWDHGHGCPSTSRQPHSSVAAVGWRSPRSRGGWGLRGPSCDRRPDRGRGACAVSPWS